MTDQFSCPLCKNKMQNIKEGTKIIQYICKHNGCEAKFKPQVKHDFDNKKITHQVIQILPNGDEGNTFTLSIETYSSRPLTPSLVSGVRGTLQKLKRHKRQGYAKLPTMSPFGKLTQTSRERNPATGLLN